ncbi:hypothetical protein GOODEAATRI_008830 [Goodea atripinnis]|uniref:Uncharacterized protein n=1 Tax=Goodea atripinnis TaxID=208336 RepID=A0ABV0MGB5_9TELE
MTLQAVCIAHNSNALTLTSFPVHAEDKHPHGIRLPPPQHVLVLYQTLHLECKPRRSSSDHSTLFHMFTVSSKLVMESLMTFVLLHFHKGSSLQLLQSYHECLAYFSDYCSSFLF